MGLFSFKKKDSQNADKADSAAMMPFPEPPKPEGLFERIPGLDDINARDLPPLPSDSNSPITQDIEKQLASLQDSLPRQETPKAEEAIDWSAPVEHPDRLPDDNLPEPAIAEKDSLSPEPSLADYDPYHEEKIDEPKPEDFEMSSEETHKNEYAPSSTLPAEKGESGMINIELPAFENEDADELKPFTLKKKETSVMTEKKKPLPEIEKKPVPKQMPFRDVEGFIPSPARRLDVDVFVDVRDYAEILKSIENSRKLLNSQSSSMSHLINSDDAEQALLHDFQGMLDSSQKTVMKIDRILFEPL